MNDSIEHPEPAASRQVAPNTSTPRSIVLRGLAIGAAVGLLGAAVLVLVMRPGESDSRGPNEAPSTEKVSTTVTTLETTTSSSTSPSASTSTTLTPDQLVSAASAVWPDGAAEASGAATVSDVAFVEDVPAAASISSDGILTFWQFDGERWGRAQDVFLDSSATSLQFIDLTGDGSAELFVSDVLRGNDFFGVVFRDRASGWVEETAGNNLQLTPTGTLRGVDEICVPSCADPVLVDYILDWNGSQFDESYVDSGGYPITVFVSGQCVDYVESYSAPLRRCDKGENVLVLQQALAEQGLLYGASPPDGYFGADTETSVRLYQLRLGVEVTGEADGQWYYDLITMYLGLDPHG